MRLPTNEIQVFVLFAVALYASELLTGGWRG